MTTTTNRRLLSLGLAGVLALSACGDFNVENTNFPTVDQLAGRLALARAATGILSQANTDVLAQIQQYGIYGRELWNLQGNDPRETGEEIRGPQEAGGRAGGQWLNRYVAIRTINAYLTALDDAVELSDTEKAASRGLAKTFAGYHFYKLALRSGPLGLPIDVDRAIDAEPAPFVSQQAAFEHAVSLLNEAFTDLQTGGAAFPFTMAPGFTGFTTPATFATFNRGLVAKVQVERALLAGCGQQCFQAAITALGQSFITTAGLPGSLTTGVYFAYDAASGEPTNPITENLTALRFWIHPSLEALVQDQPGGAPDIRWTNKVRRIGDSRTLNNLTSDLKPILYNTNTPTSSVANLGADIPLLKNEELLLIRAEANIGLGNLGAALDDINLVRQHAGGLAPSTLTASSPVADVVTELIYNRLFSLLAEQGTRWLDARKYGRLAALPRDRAGDVVHPHMLVPAGECDSRGLSVPCTPLGN
ncbi:MAG: RagB/SusD family nutrient uptake outer membrane protein [Gemmatimonadales bacterium]